MPIDLHSCINCGSGITDEILQNRYCQPEYPDIPIGPYCRDCLGSVRVCSGCQKPGIVDVTTKYYGKGRHYCGDCALTIEVCDQCNSEASIVHTIEGKRWCAECYNIHYKKCDNCEEHKDRSLFVTEQLVRAQYKGYFKKYPTSCGSCFNKNKSRFKKYKIKECKGCKALHSEEGVYCPSCWEQFMTCTCGTKDHTVYSTLIEGSGKKTFHNLCGICRATYKTCDHCDAKTRKVTRIGKVLKDVNLCDSCIDQGIEQCSTCLKDKELMKSGHCPSCSSSYKRNQCDCGATKDTDGRCRVCGGARIYNYTFKPPIHFHYTKKDEKMRENYFFGLENEVTFRGGSGSNDHLKQLYKAYGPEVLVAKEDSTIPSPGFEIVTQPVSLDYFHKMDLHPMFHNQMRNSDSCGMHIHVGREAFISDLHIFKVTDFIHSNNDKVDKVVGRSYNSYNCSLDKKASQVVTDAKKGRSGNRSSRVNLTNNDTIEFRMFATAMSEYEMRYRAEFLHALIKWSGTSSIKKSKKWSALVKYVDSNQKLYPNLNRFFINLQNN